MKLRLRSILQRLLGPRVILLAPDQSAVVLRDDGEPVALVVSSVGDEDLSLGASIAASVFVAGTEERGRLIVALASLESVRGLQ